jgi:hypothetical protein
MRQDRPAALVAHENKRVPATNRQASNSGRHRQAVPSQYVRTIPHYSPPQVALDADDFVITEKRWAVVERKASGNTSKSAWKKSAQSKRPYQLIYSSITVEARKEMEKACRHYLDRVRTKRRIEDEIAAIEDVAQRIEQIRDALKAVHQTMAARLSVADAEWWVCHLINREYQTVPVDDGGSDAPPVELRKAWRQITVSARHRPTEDLLQTFWRDADDFGSKAATLTKRCNDALKYLDGGNGIRGRREGETWDKWVADIAEVCERHIHPGQRVKVGKGNTKKAPPFARLIDALEDCLPDPWRPRKRSVETGLPGAIREALTGAKSEVREASKKRRRRHSILKFGPQKS